MTRRISHMPYNVFACLVHENLPCVLDLVENLQLLDPGSIILLYDGSGKRNLLNREVLKRYEGVYVYPQPRKMSWGRLQEFAFDAMEYAVKRWPVETITIVDSDQLLLRPGYSDSLRKFLADKTDFGLLGNSPGRKPPYSNHYPTRMAYREINLWKPFLNEFDHGIKHFVHWSFWPSTVIGAKAAKAMLDCYRTNEKLRQLLEVTKIPALEEFLFPTLASLLGFKVYAGPFSYNYVRWRAKYTPGDIGRALSSEDVFWIHPVPRMYYNPVRKRIRDYVKLQINKTVMVNSEKTTTGQVFSTLSLLDKLKSIKGWLDPKEADLLITMTHKACLELPAPHTIVEIGSYHGKSTVVLGSVLKAFYPDSRVYAIDPHEGVVGAEDSGLKKVPPSYTMLKKNLSKEGLLEAVDVIKDYSYQVKWEKPVSMIFIDGLHDYKNVSRDFRHFSKWIRVNGYIAFHDYADYYPGVVKFVDELLSTSHYCQVCKVKSLVVLQKLQ